MEKESNKSFKTNRDQNLKKLGCYTAFLAIFFLVSCKEEYNQDWRGKDNRDPKVVQEIEKDHQSLRSKFNAVSTLSFQGGYENKEKLILEFIKKLSQQESVSAKALQTEILTEEEERNIFYPSILGFGYGLDYAKTEDFHALFTQRKAQGLERMHENLFGKKVQKLKIQWSLKQNRFGEMKGEKPEIVTVQTNTKDVEIESIKQVVFFKGKYKIAVIAP